MNKLQQISLGKFLGQNSGKTYEVIELQVLVCFSPKSGSASYHKGMRSYKTACGKDLNLISAEPYEFEDVITEERLIAKNQGLFSQ